MSRKTTEWMAIANPMLLLPRVQGCTPGQAVIHRVTGLRVTESTYILDDKRKYMHLSISHPDRYPTWEELIMVKNHFIGEEEEAVQVLPRQSQYVNIHENCFHLWFCYDGDIIGQ